MSFKSFASPVARNPPRGSPSRLSGAAAALLTLLLVAPSLAVSVGAASDPTPAEDAPAFFADATDPATAVESLLRRALSPAELDLVEAVRGGARSLPEQVDLLAAAARVAGTPVSLPYRHALDPVHPLRVALVDASARLDPRAAPLNLDTMAKADALGLDYQRALALLLYAATEPNHDGIDRMALIASALEQALPTLTKYDLLERARGLASERTLSAPAATDPLTAAAYRVTAATAFAGRLLPRGDHAPLSNAFVAAAAERGMSDLLASVKPHVEGSHDLVEEVLAFYAREGLVATPADLVSLHVQAAQLPPNVAAAAGNLLHAVNVATLLRTEAIGGLTLDDLTFLRENLERVSRTASLAAPSEADLAFLEAYLATLARFDAPKMAAAAFLLTAATEANLPLLEGAPEPVQEPGLWDFLARLSPVGTARAQSSPVPTTLPTGDNDVLFSDPVARAILITGERTTRFDQRYNGGFQILTIDLGGNDVYLNNQAGATPDTNDEDGGGIRVSPDSLAPRVPSAIPAVVSLAVDVAGNDRYEPVKRRFFDGAISQGAGILGVGILVDVRGDDTYTSGLDPVQGWSMSQGFANAGVGILADLNGNDTYTTPGDVSQGAVLSFGMAMLLDLAVGTGTPGSPPPVGNDRYVGRSNSQASGMFMAEAQLFGGEDGLTAGHFRQRFTLIPAVAVLVDQLGNDRYEAMDVAQGAGEGMTSFLVDGDGADTYLAQDYSQGAIKDLNLSALSVYDTTIALVDLGEGNDLFRARSYGMGASQGLLLNLGLDNDRYESTGNRTQGFAAGLLLDRGGDDLYSATGVTDDDARRGANYYSAQPNQPNPHEQNPNERFTYAQGSSGTLRGSDGYAVGILVDLAGNDRYVSAGGRSQGWNDSYLSAGTSAGTSAGASSPSVRTPAAPAGILLDVAGDDRYEAGVSFDAAIARRGERQGTDSQDWTVDLGGSDAYSNPRRANDRGLDYSDRNTDARQEGLALFSWDVYSDYLENVVGSDPRNADETPLTDTDGDAFPNWLERQQGTYGETLRMVLAMFGQSRTFAAFTDPTNPNDPGDNPSRVVVTLDCRRNTYVATQVLILDVCDTSAVLREHDACLATGRSRGDTYLGNATLTGLILDVGGNDCHDGKDYALSRGLTINLFGNDAYRGANASLNGILDYSGLDRYRSTGPRSQSGIVDLAVSDYDRFDAKDGAQASWPRLLNNASVPVGANATAFLLNFGHHVKGDEYRAGNLSQAAVDGALATGTGAVQTSSLALLVNANGAVRFSGGDFSQAAVNAGVAATALLLTGPGSENVENPELLEPDAVPQEVADVGTFGGASANSTYLAGLSSQGSIGAVGPGPKGARREAAHSLALLFDAAGDDTYRAAAYSMASVGRLTGTSPTSMNTVAASAALLVDASGEDAYLSVPGIFLAPPNLFGEGVDTRSTSAAATPVYYEGRSLGYAETAGTGAAVTLLSPGNVPRPAVNLAALLDGADASRCDGTVCPENDRYLALERSLASSRGLRSVSAVIDVLGDEIYVAGPGSFANTTAYATALFLDGDGADKYYLAGNRALASTDLDLLLDSVSDLPLRGVPELLEYFETTLPGYVTGSVVNYLTTYLAPYAMEVVEGVQRELPTPQELLPSDGVTQPAWDAVMQQFEQNPLGLRDEPTICQDHVSLQEQVKQITQSGTLAGAHYAAPDTRARVCYDPSNFPQRVDWYLYAWNDTPDPKNPNNGAVANGSIVIAPDQGAFLNLTLQNTNRAEWDRFGREQCSSKAPAAYRNALCRSGYPAWWGTANPVYNDAGGTIARNESVLVPLCVPVPGRPLCVLSFEAAVPSVRVPSPDTPGSPPAPPTNAPTPPSDVGTNGPGANQYAENQEQAVLQFVAATHGPGNNRVWANTQHFDVETATVFGLALGIDSPVRFATVRLFALDAEGVDDDTPAEDLLFLRLDALAPLSPKVVEVKDADGAAPHSGVLTAEVRVAVAEDSDLPTGGMPSGYAHRVELVTVPPAATGLPREDSVLASSAGNVLSFFQPPASYLLPWNTTVLKPEYERVDGTWRRTPIVEEHWTYDAASAQWVLVPATGLEWNAVDGSYGLAARAYNLLRQAHDGYPSDGATVDGLGNAEDKQAWGARSPEKPVTLANAPRVLATANLTLTGDAAPRCGAAACFGPGVNGPTVDAGREGVKALRVAALLTRAPAAAETPFLEVRRDGELVRALPLTGSADPTGLYRAEAVWDGTKANGATVDNGTYVVGFRFGAGPLTATRQVLVDRVLPASTVLGAPIARSDAVFISWKALGSPDVGPLDYLVLYNETPLGETPFAPTWKSLCDARNANGDRTTLSPLCGTGLAFAGAPATAARFKGEVNRVYRFLSLARDAAGNWEVKHEPDLNVTVDDKEPASSFVGIPAAWNSDRLLLRWTATDVGTGVERVRVERCDATIAACDPAKPGWALLGNFTTSMPQQVEAVGLEHGHTYRFRTLALDRAGNLEALGLKATYSEVRVDLNIPFVSEVAVRDVTARAALVSWTTSEPTNGSVTLTALDGPRAGSTVTATETGAARTDHRLFLAGLLPGTTYRVALASKDPAGNLNLVPPQGDAVFSTAPLLRGAFQYPTANATLAETATLRWSAAHLEGANVTATLTLVDESGNPMPGRTTPLHTETATEGPLEGYRTVDVDTLAAGDCHRCRLQLTLETAEERLVALSPAFDIDNLPPTVTLGADGAALGEAGWFNAALRLRLDGADAGAGVKAIYYGTGEANVYDRFERRLYTGPFSVPDGTHTLRFYAEDHAGRESPLQERVIRVDTAAPIVTSFTTATPRVSSGEALLRIEATDGGSGLKEMRLRVNGGEWTPWDAFRPTVQVQLPGPDGVKSVEAEVRDVAGNPSAAKVLSLTLDTTAPSLTDLDIVPGAGEAAVTWRTDEATRGELRLLSPDGGVTRVPSNGLGLRHSLTLLDLAPGGLYTVELTFTDETGLKSAITSRTFTLSKDSLPPSPVEGLAGAVQNGRVVLTWTPASDNVGVLKYRVSRELAEGLGAAPVVLADTPAVSFLDLDAPGAALRYAVSALDAAGNEGPAARVTLVAPGTSGFESTSITPDRALVGTPVTFAATYRPADGAEPPASVVLVLGEERYAMVPDGATATGALRYTLTLTLPPLNLSAKRVGYHLEALTATATHRYPALGDLPGPVVAATPAALAESGDEGESFFARVPAPALLGSLAAFMVGAAGLAWFTHPRRPRRKSP